MYIEEKLGEILKSLQDIKEMLEVVNPNENKEILDNQDVMQLLNISSRTLQNYRDQGIMPFSKIEGKIYYKMKDLIAMIDKNYHQPL